MNKPGIRRRILEKRTALSTMERDDAAAKAAHAALELLKDIKGAIALYHARSGELSPAKLAEDLHRLGKQLCLPVVTDENVPLLFRAWSPDAPLEKGYLGIAEPLQNAPLITPQTLIVPLLAFDGSCHRLGAGGGFYDSTFRDLRGKNELLQAFGYAFALQEVDTLPCEPHDEFLDAVITECGIVWPGREVANSE